MRTARLGGHTVRIYDSVDELPVVNFQKYNRYLLIDSGIGSDVDDIDAHITKLARLIGADRKADALQELQNMRQCIYMVNNAVSPKHMAFAALIRDVDGEDVSDLSDTGLAAVMEKLRKEPRSRLVDMLLRFKKKADEELETYFPEEFTGPREKDTYDRLKARTALVLDAVATGTDRDAEVDAIDAALFGMYRPKAFDGAGSAEVAYEKSFETACLVIAQKTGADPKKMTVLQFYNALDMVKKQAEAESKGLGLHKGRR